MLKKEIIKQKYNIKYLILMILILFIISIIIVSKTNISNITNKKTINVEVKGEVKKEGNYELELGSSFGDLLELIELKENADISSYNNNLILSNNQVIIIPKTKEYNLVSINSASYDELISLKGIGPSLANLIIEYRENNGGFKNIEDLKNIRGIGEKKFNNIKEYITL